MTKQQSVIARYWPVFCGIVGVVAFGTLIGGRILYRPFNTPSVSMEPTLIVGDNFLVDQLAYQNVSPARGDVIVLRAPRGENWIKRVVGLPGDHVQLINGILTINGTAVPQRRVADFVETDSFGITTHIKQLEETLPGGRSYSVIDRGDSEEDNTGDFAVPADSYFVLGDNRDNSDDSRLSLGFVKRADIVGRATKIYFSGGSPVWRDVR